MLSDRSRKSVNRLLTLLCVGFAFGLVSPTVASAADDRDPMSYLPADSKFGAQVDIDRLRGSKYFEKAVNFVESRAKGKNNSALGKYLTSDEGAEFRSSLETVAVGLPDSRIESPEELKRGTFVLAGEFDKEKLGKSIRAEKDLESREYAGLAIQGVDNLEFAFSSSNRLIFAKGPKSYRNSVWKLASEGGESFQQSAEKRNLFDGLDTSKAFWMVNDLRGLDAQKNSGVNSAAVSLNLDSGLDLQLVTQAPNKAKGGKITKQLETMKQNLAENPMLSMFGASPLVNNMAVEQDGKTVVATSSMTESELDTLVANVRQMVASQSQVSMPSSGDSASDGESSESKETDGK